MAPFGLKLKLNTSATPTPSGTGSPAQTPAQTPGGGLKLTFKQPGAPASATVATHAEAAPDSAPPVKQKRKYTKKPKDPNSAPASTKKRAFTDGDESTPKRAKKQANNLVIKPPTEPVPGQLSRTPSISLKLKPQRAPTQPKLLVIKTKGQKPERPAGVGYDSEAEDAEDDPAIESQFILRMTPGEDCDTLRKAIEDRTIGDAYQVSFRFWDREGKRVSIKIRDHIYAGSFVDLPCIIEGTKSWDKKGWYKAADISQMLLVLGRAMNDKEVENFPLPPEIQRVYDQESGLYQYPHGLTPPMHNVRKRRFRKRVSYRTIEAVEEEVERLWQLDEEARINGGTVVTESLDPEQMHGDSDADADADGDQEDESFFAEGDEEQQYGGEEDDEDDELMEAMMEDALGDAPDTAVSANEVALHALNSGQAELVLPSTEGQTPVDSTAGTPMATADTGEEEDDEDDDDEDDDDGDADADEEEDEDTKAAQQEKAQLREEIADLEKEVEIAHQQHEQQKNPLLRKRAAQKLMSLKQDLATKKSELGEGDDEE